MTNGPQGWRRYFPVPFVAAVTLLLVLVLLTPNLISFGNPAAGSLETQAYLVIDRAQGTNATHLYIRSLGNARYHSVTIDVATNVSWPPPQNLTDLAWQHRVNETNVLVATFTTLSDPFLANISVVYIDAAGVTEQYIGEFEFHYSGGNLDTETFTPGLAPVAPIPERTLPEYLELLALPLR
ncbi:MAG: hypothetical protein L3K19_08725 [Thermoplasmata archaeon]|nr:hypothetical protein [Thermoplasmata archaeon]